MQIDKLTYVVIGAAIKVHRHFGAGFTEEIYKNSLFIELNNMGLKSEKEVNLDILYDNTPVGYFKADIIVEKKCLTYFKVIVKSCIFAPLLSQNILRKKTDK